MVAVGVGDRDVDVVDGASDKESSCEEREEAAVADERASMPLCRNVAAALLVSSLPLSGI